MSSIRDILTHTPKTTTLQGWVRTSRFAKRITFLSIYDGSCDQTLQVVVKPAVKPELRARLGVGTAVEITGKLIESKGSGQDYELSCRASGITIVGDCDPGAFPIQKKGATHEFLRTIPHLRVRTAEFQRTFLLRDLISRTIHQHLGSLGFMWVHTPIITFSDCEGAGEMFSVATPSTDFRDLGRSLDRHPGPGESISSVVATARADERPWPKPPLKDDQFFGQAAFLTVSGQLEVEPFALAFSKVYTFGPTFRSEQSRTSRHASEFWMIEPEIAFATVTDVMDTAEALLKAVLVAIYQAGFGLAEHIGFLRSDWPRVTHAEAQDILVAAGREWEFPVGRGCSLQSEHERYLAEEHFGGPVFVTHYPADQKPFYMRVTRTEPWDGTVECFDLLVPGVGEVIGGSAREEDYDTLKKAMGCHGLDLEVYDWYLDLRRFGSVPHGGFGIGLERLVMWLGEVANIRDPIPFPRTPA